MLVSECEYCGSQGRLDPEDIDGIPVVGLPCPHCKDGKIVKLEDQIAALERELDPAVCRLQFPDGSVPSNAREAAEGWKRWYEKAHKELASVQAGIRALLVLEREACAKIIDEKVEHARECHTDPKPLLRLAAAIRTRTNSVTPPFGTCPEPDNAKQ